MKIFPILYSRASTGKIQQWQIISDGDAFYTVAGQQDGQLTRSSPNKCLGKNVGKKNETSPESQAELEATAKFEKKIKEGYREDISEIDDIGFVEPMLAKKYEDYFHKLKFPVAKSPKMNGIRCVIHIRDGKLGAFSRKGEQFFCVEHILEDVGFVFEKNPNAILDGELFNPKYKNELNVIASLVSVNRKAKDVTPEDEQKSKEIVQYHVYDGYEFNGVQKETPYSERIGEIEKLLINRKYTYPLGYEMVFNDEQVRKELKETAKKGEEGIIIRILDSPYENKRSKYLLKLKNFSDAEFEIVGFTEGSGNWAGCAKTVICKIGKPTRDSGDTFESNIRGTMVELADLWKNKNKFVGQYATVTYQELSPYGVPLIPYCGLPFRNFE